MEKEVKMKERCLKCLMSSIDGKGKKIYDHPNKDGNGPDCDVCLDPNSNETSNSLEAKRKGGEKYEDRI